MVSCSLVGARVVLPYVQILYAVHAASGALATRRPLWRARGARLARPHDCLACRRHRLAAQRAPNGHVHVHELPWSRARALFTQWMAVYRTNIAHVHFMRCVIIFAVITINVLPH